MANTKIATYASPLDGTPHYCIIRNEDTLLYLDSTGNFISFSTDVYLPMVEDAVLIGNFTFTDNTNVWLDGKYSTTVYLRYGLTPDHTTDLKVAYSEFIIRNDTQVDISTTVSDIQSSISSLDTILNEVRVDIKRVLGLLHENHYIDDPIYDSDGNLIGGRVRIYSDAISVGTNNNVIATYLITSSGDGPGKFTFWSQVKV